MKGKKLRALVVEPGKKPYVKYICDSYEVLKSNVRGSIEMFYPYDLDTCFVSNETGKLDMLPLNRALKDDDGYTHDIIAGTFLIFGSDYGELTDISDKDLKKYTSMFAKPEKYPSKYFMSNNPWMIGGIDWDDCYDEIVED